MCRPFHCTNCGPEGERLALHCQQSVLPNRILQTLSYERALTWSSVLMDGERPPCTQNIRLSISADKLQKTKSVGDREPGGKVGSKFRATRPSKTDLYDTVC